MIQKTVFISSTYKDLYEYRKAVWGLLPKFNVDVRGMEAFGARTSCPAETCLAEVEQSEVYVGIIAFRLGSIEPASGRSFTELEYERAAELNKEIRIYLAREDASFPANVIDTGTKAKARLDAFKKRLRDKHTIVQFSTVEDLVHSLKSDFERLFEQREPTVPDTLAQVFENTSKALSEFRLTPKRFNGTEIRLSVSFTWGPYAASRDLCRVFNLDYGSTIGVSVRITRPAGRNVTDGFTELYASGSGVDALRELRSAKNGEIFAILLFAEEDVKRTQAEFLGRSYFPDGDYDDDGSVYVPPEGKVIMLFTKPA